METLDDKAYRNKHRYSQKTERYCLYRMGKAAGEWPVDSERQERYLFWINMHYYLLLMKTASGKEKSGDALAT